MLTPKAAQDALRTIWETQRPAEADRLERIHDALKPYRLPSEFVPTVQIPDDAPTLMKELARKSETNYLPLLLDTYSQVLKVDGYQSAASDEPSSSWLDWQRNRMDARQTGLHRSTLQYGTAYALALPGTLNGESAPAVRCFSPRRMTALYQDAEFDEWPMLAAYVDGSHLVLLDEDGEYRFGDERGVLGTSSSLLPWPGSLTPLQPRSHGLGFVPVVRYRDRMLLSGEEQLGIVEPLLTIQERIHEQTFQGMVAGYFEAFRQRYVLGWVPKSEQEELKAGAARIWYIDEDPANVKIDALPAGDPRAYLEPRAQAIRDFAAIGQIPAQSLGVDGISNISDATLAGLEAAKNRRAGEIQTSLGESHEQLMRLCGHIRGDDSAASDVESEVRWRDFEARSFAATVDGIVKLVQAQILPPEMAVEEVPGVTQQEARRAQAGMRRARAAAMVAGLTGTPSVGAG
jgi:hypothetical protein